MPQVALNLIRAIDRGDASVIELEKILVDDPLLTAELLRSSAPLAKADFDYSPLRQLIIRMGQRSLRAVAMALSMRAIMQPGPRCAKFNYAMFSRHSQAVGILARYLQARVFSDASLPDTCWSGDELFAAGIMHDIGFAVLAKTSPDEYERVHSLSTVLNVSMERAFEMCFEDRPESVFAEVYRAWGFPQIFVDAQLYMHRPFRMPNQVRGLGCLHLAHHLAQRSGESLDGKVYEENPATGIETIVPLPEDEIPALLTAVGQQLDRAFPAARPRLVVA
ncbi:MAG TPA: HDOD domain-containing protein [Fimbriimonadaceae bacterium]|nr:HDOD domain-containing protein [Fimbriimonadaceae bacterium]